MTLDDLEQPKHSCGKKSFYTAQQKNLSMAKCRWMILVSRNIRYMRIFAGVPRGEGVKRQWGCWRA